MPGDAVLPEGIAIERRAQRLFVSSTNDGTIFRGSLGRAALTPFAPGGADGRTNATGIKADNRGRLFVSGADTGKAFVLSTRTGRTLKVLDSRPGTAQTFMNDVALAGGHAYCTDSMRPIIFRASTRRATVGELFRIDTRRKTVSQIDIGATTLDNGDGLVSRGSRLYVVRNAQQEIVEIRLRRDRRAGRVVRRITSRLFKFPTTAARDGNRLLAVNSQFNRRGGTPELPFDVVAVRRP